MGLIAVGGWVLGMASAAPAQLVVSIGQPSVVYGYGGMGYGSSFYQYGVPNSGYIGSPTVYAPGFSIPSTTYYSSGYQGYAAPAVAPAVMSYGVPAYAPAVTTYSYGIPAYGYSSGVYQPSYYSAYSVRRFGGIPSLGLFRGFGLFGR